MKKPSTVECPVPSSPLLYLLMVPVNSLSQGYLYASPMVVKRTIVYISERCGPVIGGGTGPETEPPQPLVTREPSVSLLRWERPAAPTASVHDRHRRTEPLSLATLERDCFVIPAHALSRFLPDGVPVSTDIPD